MFEIDKMPSSIDIGYTGETCFRKIEIDMTAWMEKMPAGVPSIIAIRPWETKADAYIAATTFADNILTWEITDADLGTEEGDGEIQVWLEEEADDTVTKRGKSIKIKTHVIEAVEEADENPPAPQQGWITQMTALKDAMENAAAHGPVIDEETGNWKTWDAEEEEYEDTGVHAQGDVADVKVNGTSVVTDGVANIPAATNSSFGVTTTSTSNGLNIGSTGSMRTYPALDTDIKGGTQEFRPIVAKNQHQAAFYGLAKAAGDTSQSASSNAVGNYTADAIVKIQKMLGIYKAPWEQIRADTITNATADNIVISVDDNGQPFELTDIAIAFILSAQTGDSASYGEYGRIRYYYDDTNHDDTISNGINIAVGGSKRGFYTFVEQNDNMLLKRVTTQIENGSNSGLAMYTRDTRTSELFPISILTEKRIYNKIEFRAVKGIADFVIYGRRKPT